MNKLVQNTVWSQRGNFIEVPTDCPQRDERLGWTGDAQVFAPTACYLNDSHDILAKWLRDVMADQRPDGGIAHVSPDPFKHIDALQFYGSTGWGDAICVVPWVLYTHYGDRSILEETLPAMIRWNDFVWSISNGPIVRPPSDWAGRGFTFGDWLQPQHDFLKASPPWAMMRGDDLPLYLVGADGAYRRPARGQGAGQAAEPASRRGQEGLPVRVHHRLGPHRLRRPIVLRAGVHVRPHSGRACRSGQGLLQGHHCTCAWPHRHGFIGTPALLPALVKIGEPELAAAVFLQEEVPGWLYQVKRGATTIWERWDAIQADGSIFDPQMNSYNHYAYGAVCQWLFEGVAGFRPDPARPGFRHIIFEPTIIPALSPVAATHDSAAGRIEAKWSVDGSHRGEMERRWRQGDLRHRGAGRSRRHTGPRRELFGSRRRRQTGGEQRPAGTGGSIESRSELNGADERR